jgi:DNA-3-methyladenine glycosylase II
MQLAVDHLSKHDRILAPLIKDFGLCTIKPHDNHYQELVESIVGQQLSVKAAATILKRFRALYGQEFPEPEAILQTSVEDMRLVGLSRGKAAYIRDLAQHVVDGQVKFDHFGTLTNEEIVAELTDVKGIGEWTAHMFLMFSLGRLDVLAHGDLGIRSGVKKLYNLSELPSPQHVKDIANANGWAPYQTVACWYIWKSLDNVPAVS